MRKAALPVLLTLMAATLFLSCERLAQPADSTAEIATKLESIPVEYGELEAVTSVPEYPGWFQLWFQDSTGTIRMVRIQTQQNLIHNQIEVIPRTGAAAVEGM